MSWTSIFVVFTISAVFAASVTMAWASQAPKTEHRSIPTGEAQSAVGHHTEIPKGFVAAGTPVAPGAETRLRTATFGAGCFWGVEAVFRSTKGVTHTAVGFSGGRPDKTSYREVCFEETGHAEVVEVLFDPELVSYEQLLEVFWANHNPTTLNSQGPDFGTQYRSVVFFHDDAQRDAAAKSRDAVAASGKWGKRPIVTQVAPAQAFYIAEEYHQQYLEKRGKAFCH